ncbi:nuclear autoantigenic sperm protein isoform X9 [Callithrix jacchus]
MQSSTGFPFCGYRRGFLSGVTLSRFQFFLRVLLEKEEVAVYRRRRAREGNNPAEPSGEGRRCPRIVGGRVGGGGYWSWPFKPEEEDPEVDGRGQGPSYIRGPSRAGSPICHFLSLKLKMFLLLLHLQIKWRATINLLSVTEDGLHFVEYYLNRIIHLDVDSEAKKLLGLGQKHLVMGDIPAAVNAFQEAASLLGKKYGETANECGEAFFFYGKSLLELARMENGVLGNALEGVHVEEEEGEKTEDESLVENNDNIDETEGSEEDDKENDKAEEMPNDSVLENKSLQENEEEEIGNLELAWDMLDLAKIIFKRQETKEAQLYAAQAHLKLGEVSVESENYVQAVEEFQSCLNLQEQYLEAHDRLLAETHYQLGLAYGYNSQYDEAVAQFSKSIEVIEKRMAVLNEQVKEAERSSAECKKEIEELKELLPEIREKIEDAKESQRSGNVAELALKATLVESSTSGFTPSGGISSVSMIASRKPTDGASSSNCVTDISHLVRKKRKPEEESPRKDDAKKAKQEPEVNGGSGDAVSSGNEVLENTEEAENQAESRVAVEGTVEAGATVESTAC